MSMHVATTVLLLGATLSLGACAKQAPAPERAAEVTAESLAQWHETAASNAALRGQEARKVSEGYAKNNMSVAADRHGAVADLAEAEAGFHAAAARIVRKN